MKSKFSLLNVVLATALLFSGSCSDEQVTPKKGKALFSLKATQSSVNGGRGKDLSDAKAVLVTIESEGNPVYQMEELTLLHFGDDLVSEQLQLPVGNYTITELFVVDEHNNVLAVAPIENSAGAEFVSDPLPIDFSVNNGETSAIAIEVIGLENASAEFFGYATFDLKVKSVTALIIPEINENVIRVNYILSSGNSPGSDVIEGEGEIINSVVKFENPALIGKTWNVRIYVWHEGMVADKYPLLYRYRGKITFNGSIIQLPSLENEQWAHMMYREKTQEGELFKVFISADPRNEQFDFELHMPDNRKDEEGQGVIDRGFWNLAGDELCVLHTEYVWQRYTPGIREATIFDSQSSCLPDEDYSVDSMLHFRYGEEEITFVNYFSWDVINGVIQPPTTEPYDPVTNGNGRSRTPARGII